MPGPTLDPVPTDLNLPDRVDCVVIGGGIIGTSTALELAERGLRVALCEKGQIGAEQSSRNWGWVRLSCRDPREIPLMISAIRAWEGMEARTGHRMGYTQTGILFAAASAREQAEYDRWSQHLQPHQIECRLIQGAELGALLPGHAQLPRGALYTPMDGRAEPQWAAPGIAKGARAAGATIHTGCAVRSLDTEGGRVTGVITEKGRIRCDTVVLAGGVWSRLFAGNAGIELPQLKVLNTVMRTTPVDGGPEAAAWAPGFAIRKRADGGYTIADGTYNIVDLVPDTFRLMRQFLPALKTEWKSLRFRVSDRWRQESAQARRWTPADITPFERSRILDPEPVRKIVKSSWAAARRAFPVLESAEIAQAWAGMIDVTPDAIPVISPVDDLPGLFMGTGFSGHGFGIGPGAGQLLADLVTGHPPVVDPHAFRLSRFSDGSPVRPESGF
ncbi:FAD-binding oxidoreductase [Aestuariivita sp.]|jgi:glycine/D-amino acid oxidase-like deaminating enzyme|uniref:NAD(P)/FAD-dependent oxidoreductase n=1 Tax=Aestuariivita sp. TaxID=1872407 RepID=UPI00216BF540|nr:FAD-binding oxidoreductase [Aestuariivita sp.]MCE8008388.1 FAD-binding oxidoreductase [Aestuariivita sp.]